MKNRLSLYTLDCFERIVIQAMIPFERTFRTTDTNQLQICERLCIAEGDKCQTYSLGIRYLFYWFKTHFLLSLSLDSYCDHNSKVDFKF